MGTMTNSVDPDEEPQNNATIFRGRICNCNLWPLEIDNGPSKTIIIPEGVGDYIFHNRVKRWYKEVNSSLAGSIFVICSAVNLCKQFGPRSRPTECRSWSGSKAFDTLIVFLFFFLFFFFKKLILRKVSRGQQKHEKLHSRPRVKILNHIMILQKSQQKTPQKTKWFCLIFLHLKKWKV